ncbi:hypothetical protein DL95DRAFT_372620 [Leptodontidium sp. 2 PMI_412]|nr:hypothetical protein BKA61DRAFT_362136 [Leptodontidium sp. MPI-SDFR-AT-0119]KAH9209092.1 hypothetical protein DL95DRAFT_372620 [Leptodontidium sp. 2 PMI_412]
MPVTFEGTQYHASLTSPYIPYTLYISETHLLLVPREVQQIHPNFPKDPAPTGNIRLELSDTYKKQFKAKYQGEPKFSVKDVGFGLDDDEVVVAGILQGTNWIPHWEFSSLFKGDLRNLLESSSDVKASFGLMEWDLKVAAGPGPQ